MGVVIVVNVVGVEVEVAWWGPSSTTWCGGESTSSTLRRGGIVVVIVTVEVASWSSAWVRGR